MDKLFCNSSPEKPKVKHTLALEAVNVEWCATTPHATKGSDTKLNCILKFLQEFSS